MIHGSLAATMGPQDPRDIKQPPDLVPGSPEALPTFAAVESCLEQLFVNGLLPEATSGDAAQTWSRRWLLLLRALAARILSLEPTSTLEAPPKQDGRDHPYSVVDKDGRCFGVSSPRIVVVPAPTAPWEELEKLPSLADGLPADRVVMGWFELLEELRAHSTVDGVPGWFTYYRRVWLARNRMSVKPTFGFGFLAPPLSVVWGGHDAHVLHLPTSTAQRERQNLEHLRVVLQFFGIELETMEAQQLADEMPELAALNDEKRCPTYVPFGPSVDPMPRKVVWRCEAPALAEALRFGFVLLRRVVNGRQAFVAAVFSLQGGWRVEVLDSEQDILVAQVEPLGDNMKLKDDLFPDYPVRLEYAGLVERTAKKLCEPSIPDRACRYEFGVRGIGRVIVRDVGVAKTRPGTFFLWPKFRPAQVRGKDFKAYYALVQSTRTGGKAWFFGTSSSTSPYLDWSVTLNSDQLAQPLFSLNGASVDGGIPALMAVVEKADTAPLGSGLFSCPLSEVKDLGEEQWGVDLGTQDCVVAVSTDQGVTREVEVIPFGGELDATLVFAENETKPLSSCYWFPTWDGFAPRVRDSRLWFPSRLLLTDRDPAHGLAGVPVDVLPYGRSFVFDNGAELDEDLLCDSPVVRDLKWLDESGSDQVAVKRLFRRSYLLHLLSMCFVLRAGLSGRYCKAGLPTSVTVVFTLPIRMRGPDGRLARDYAEDGDRVCALLGMLLGRRFEARFVWEPHAGARRERLHDEIHAVADLGWHRLELWGAIGRPGDVEYADSCRFGVQDLVEEWCATQNEEGERQQQIEDFRRRMQIDADRALDRIREDRHCTLVQIGFFELVKEAIACWIGALVHEARAKHREAGPTHTVNLTLLGQGWRCHPLAVMSNAIFVSSIRDHAARLLAESGGGKVEVRALNPALEPEDPTQRRVTRFEDVQRTHLAKMAARMGGQRIGELLKLETRAFLGCNLFQPDGRKHEWFKTIPLQLDPASALELAFDRKNRQAQPEPCLVRHTLSRERLTDILLHIARGVLPDPLAPQYDGPSPFSLVLESLRGRSKPEDS
jgi:hypothetical protein